MPAMPAPLPAYDGAAHARGDFHTESAPADPRIVWQTDLGRGFTAAPIVRTPAVIATLTGRYLSIHGAESGARYWERRFSAPLTPPVLLGSRIYFATQDAGGHVHAAELQGGSVEWRTRVRDVLFAPLVDQARTVVATAAGLIIGLDTRDGRERWRSTLNGGPAVTPPVATADGFLVATQHDTLVHLGSDGRVRSALPLPATPTSAPLVTGDTAVVSLHSGAIIALRLDGTPLWSARLPHPALAAPIRIGADVFALTRNGELWRVRAGQASRVASLGSAATRSLAVVREGFLIGLLDGSLHLIAPDGRTLWKLQFDDSIDAPVAVEAGALFVPLLNGGLAKVQ